MKSKLLGLMILLGVMVGSVLPTVAQSSTFTITEDYINQTFRVTNPPRTTISAVSVDLQVGQVVIYATITPRRTGVSTATATTLYPLVSNGSVDWEVSSVTVNGVAASQDIVNTANNTVAATWRVYFREQTDADLASITINDTDIVYVYTGDHVLNPSVNLNSNGASLTITEADVNSAITVRSPITSASVDFQPNQVVLNATGTVKNASVNATATLTASIVNGQIDWVVTNMTLSISTTKVTKTQVQNTLLNIWDAYWVSKTGKWELTSINITDTEIVVSGTQE